MGEADKKELAAVGFLDLFVSFVALYSVVLLFLCTFLDLSPEVQRILAWADNGMCALFIFDIIKRWRAAENKVRFWRWAWIDIIASIPMLPWLRWGRSLRLIRIMRMLRVVESVRMLHVHLFKGRRVSAAALSFFIFYSMVMICAPAILMAESGAPGSTIKTAGDAVWWVFETMSTVGYGDYYPVTTAGRVVGAATMLLGVGMFGAMTATVLAYLGIDQEPAPGIADLQALRRENEELKARVSTLAGKTTGGAGPRNDCNLA